MDSASNSYVAGTFQKDIDLGGMTLTTSTSATFLAKPNPAGDLVWATLFDSDSLSVVGLAWHGTAGLIAAGSFTGSLSCGGTLTSAGGRDAVLMALSE